ncbi:fibronectin type III domain-containing protein [SAR86 cluster bacterium]|nr:fibronectin type III domain-containing protein [SAR86 cluster bacterium]
MNKFLLFNLLLPFFLFSEDLKIADDFQEGDLLSAETFNQIFDTIEKINRTIVTEDLIGTWSCDAMTTRQTDGWADKSLYYLLEDAQVNFAVGSEGTTGINVLTTSSPSPFKRQSSSFSGEFSVLNNKLFTKNNGENESRIWSINFISESRFELTFLETSAQSFPASYSSFITCDTTVAVPAAPTSPSAVNAKTSINLTWVDSSVGETGFKVYRKQGSNEFSLVSTQTTTSYIDSDTSEGATYEYYISSYNDNGESKKSKVVSATLDSINPFVVSTLPVDGENYSGTTVTITFNEVIEIKCPEGQSGPTLCGALPAIELVGTGGSGNTYYMGQVGEKGISISGAPFVDGANPNYSVTVSKDHIFDLNGNQMEEDFTFSFTDG